MDIDTFRGLITAALLILFVSLAIWTWSRNRKDTYDKAARMPLEETERPAANSSGEQQQ
jgi:cytochrome c oxidase cbb3-type subunit 4